MKKIIILVLTYDDGGAYSLMDETVRNTWGNIKNDNVKVYYYYSKLIDSEYIVDGDTIYCNGLESSSTIGEKTIKAFKHLINEDFDYLLRTNSSSFIHLDNLIKYLNDSPKDNFYSGVVCPYHNDNLNIDFISGSGYILSQDLVRHIVNNENKWDHSFPDDVSIGKLMFENNVTPTPKEWIKIQHIPNKNELVPIEIYSSYTSMVSKQVPYDNLIDEIGDKHQIRCKIESRFDIDSQIEIFKELNKLIYKI